MDAPLRMAALGIDHRHIYGMAANMIDAGATFCGWWTRGSPGTLAGFEKRFPEVPRHADPHTLLQDPAIDLILISAVPDERAALAIEAMEAGKDVMVDKPGCLDLQQLQALRDCVARTGRIWSVNFSERFEVRSVTRAAELVQAGAIGRVLQTVGLGPHRMNAPSRPDWFFDPARYGGILCDIASHQIDQYLYLTGATDVEISLASVRNFAHPDHPDFQDFGELALRADAGHAYVRVDWFTADALPTWGDGRLTILGTDGTLELRKYVDVAGAAGTDHLFLVNASRCEKIDCDDAGLPYFARLSADIRARSDTAVPQAHTFTVTELAIRAQMLADAR